LGFEFGGFVNRTPVMLTQQFGANREFLNHYRPNGFPEWTNWKFTRDEVYRPLLNACTDLCLFGNVVRPEGEYILSGDGFYKKATSDQILNWRFDASYNDHLASTEKWIQSRFECRDGFLRAKGLLSEIIDDDICESIFGGIANHLSVHFMLQFSVDEFDVVSRAIRRHALTSVNGRTFLFGDWRSQDKLAKKIVKSGRIAVVIKSGQCRIFYPAAIDIKVQELVEYLKEMLLSRLDSVENGSFWSSVE
jgi:hypothetical protein